MEIKKSQTWEDYCVAINVDKRIVNRWLARLFGRVLSHEKTPSLPEGKYDVILADPLWKYEISVLGIAGKNG